MTLILTLLACFQASDRVLDIMELQGDPVAGDALYQSHCSSCHGADALGGSGPDLVDEMSHSTERFLDWTLYGKSSDMPAFDEVLEDQEIADIYAYMETLVEE